MKVSRRTARRNAAALALCGLLLAATGAGAEVVRVETHSDYLLDGASADALRRQLQARVAQRGAEGGVISHGLTRAELATRWHLQPLDEGGCRLERIEVRLTIDTLLPAWRPAGRPEPGLAPRVRAMLAGLARHEAGHREAVIEAADAIDAGLRALPPAAECRSLRRAAERLVSRGLVRLRARGWNYDLATGRGRSQGAVLELGPAPAARRSATRR